MRAQRWAELDRTALREVLPGAVVVVPVGAVEQHGPHLPTSTDIAIATAVAEAGADRAAGNHAVDVVVTPGVTFGASHHHLAFGGTISLRPETLLAVLRDVLTSLAACGARRVLLVNGHGGNVGICHAAAAMAAAELAPLLVAHVDYWSLLRSPGVDVPGHAGRFETALMSAVTGREYPTTGVRRDDVPEHPVLPGVQVHARARWQEIDGYTDDPGRATSVEGQALLDELAATLAERIAGLAKEPT